MYDEETDLMVELVLNFFPFDNSVQVLDPKKGKNLLRRVQLPSLTMEMLQIGNIVNIFAKLILIKDCAPVTKRTLFNKQESTFVLIKPGPMSDRGKVITYIMKKGFRIVNMKNAKVSKELAMELYQNCAGSDMLPIIIDYITTGEVVGLELVAADAVKYFRECLGATDPKLALTGTLRQLYGYDTLRNIAHGCNTREDAAKVFDYFDKYIFLCEMYDEETDLMVELVLNFFPFDNSVQVLDPKKGKNLLRRVQLPSLTMEMLQIGNIVNIFAKLILIKDCAPVTKRTLFNKQESTFVLIKPGPMSDRGKVITYIMKKGFRIVNMKNAKVSKELAMELYQNCAGSDMLPIIIDYITTGEVVGLELVAADAVKYFRECLGATDPKLALTGTLRQLYGYDTLRNIAHGCNTREDAAKILDWFFGKENNVPKIPFQATLKDCTCCIIKPHVLTDGHLGNIIDRISTSNKFYISAMAMFSVKIHDAKEFYEIYKGVVSEYEEMAIHLTEGKCVVLEVKCEDPKINVVQEFRKFCGPRDPDLCRQLYPESIRALYGKNLVHNAVHCTDLEADAETEIEYFFKLLANMPD